MQIISKVQSLQTLILSSLVSEFKSQRIQIPKILFLGEGKGEVVGGGGRGGRKGETNRLESRAQTGRDNDRML